MIFEYCDSYDVYYIEPNESTNELLVYHEYNTNNYKYANYELYKISIKEEYKQDIIKNKDKAESLSKIFGEFDYEMIDFNEYRREIIEAVSENKEYQRFMEQVHKINGTENIVDYMSGIVFRGEWYSPNFSLHYHLRHKYHLDDDDTYALKEAFEEETGNNFAKMCELFVEFDAYNE